MSDEKHSQVAQRASQIWQREGRPDGRADAHWKQAEEELAREAGGTGSSKQSPPYVPTEEPMIEPAGDSPVVAGVSVPSEPPVPAAEAEERKRAATAPQKSAAPVSRAAAPKTHEPDKAGSKSSPSKSDDKKTDAKKKRKG